MDFGFTGLFYLDAVWVMNRTPEPTAAVLSLVNDFFKNTKANKKLDYEFPGDMHKTV